MTAFAGGVFVLPNFVDPIADAALFLTFFDNPVVVTVVIVLWVFYFFIIHWTRRADKMDEEKVPFNQQLELGLLNCWTYSGCPEC